MFSELPLPLQDLLAVLIIFALCGVLVASAAQDLKGQAVLSAVVELVFGAIVLCMFAYGSRDAPIRLVGTIVVAVVYAYAINVTCQRYRSSGRG